MSARESGFHVAKIINSLIFENFLVQFCVEFNGFLFAQVV
jgi:hypothetical protein